MQGTQTKGASHPLVRTPWWHIIQIVGTRSKHPVTLGSFLKPILERRKQCMQRIESPKLPSMVACRPSKQRLCVHMRTSRVISVRH